jgi:hypothetical protein
MPCTALPEISCPECQKRKRKIPLPLSDFTGFVFAKQFLEQGSADSNGGKNQFQSPEHRICKIFRIFPGDNHLSFPEYGVDLFVPPAYIRPQHPSNKPGMTAILPHFFFLYFSCETAGYMS